MLLETDCYCCPYCGERVEVLLDLSAGDQQFIEDCPVCCRPVLFDMQVDGGAWTLTTRTEND